MSKRAPKAWRDLTERQVEVGILLMEGELSRAEIAGRLGIGVKTVDSHRMTLLRGLSLESNVQLCWFGIKHKLVKVRAHS